MPISPPDRDKISPEFARRLSQLEPHEKVRLVLLLQTSGVASSPNRQSKRDRRTRIAAMQQSAAASLNAIADLIGAYDGQLLRDRPDALGSIPVKIAAAEALATSGLRCSQSGTRYCLAPNLNSWYRQRRQQSLW